MRSVWGAGGAAILWECGDDGGASGVPRLNMSGTPLPPERHVPVQLARDGGADAADALQAVQRPEGAVGRSVGDNAPSERWADEGEAFDFVGGGAVDVDDEDGGGCGAAW